MCLNARSLVNKKNELNIMVEDIDPYIIGITEPWDKTDITDAELGLPGYVRRKMVSGNSKLTIGLVYRSPNIKEEDNTKIQNAIKEVSKGECIIMGDFNHGHIQWKSLESTGGEDQQFLF